MRQFIVTMLACSLQFSLCTGGALALATYGISTIGIAYDDSAPMSYGAVEYLSCKHIDTESRVTHPEQAADCDDSDTCLQQAHVSLRDRLVLPWQAVLDIIAVPVAATEFALESQNIWPTAREGPIFAESNLLAHIVVKRE